jgi:hypothetical protein
MSLVYYSTMGVDSYFTIRVQILPQLVKKNCRSSIVQSEKYVQFGERCKELALPGLTQYLVYT